MASGTDSPLIPDLGHRMSMSSGADLRSERLPSTFNGGSSWASRATFGVAGFSMWVAVMVISRSNCGVEALS